MSDKTEIDKPQHCANCDYELKGENFCPQCGQSTKFERPRFLHFISESLANALAFDSKFYRTFVTLYRHPGKVAREYINGKRMMYMNPVRFYFLSSLVLIFFTSALDDGLNVHINDGNEAASTLDSVNALVVDSAATEVVNQLDSISEDEDLSVGFNIDSSETNNMIFRFTQENPDVELEEGLDSLGLEHNWNNRFTYTQFKKLNSMNGQEFGEFLSSKLFWILFWFLPIYAIWLKLIYVRNDVLYFEHLFFAFYTQSAFFIMLTVATIVDWLGPDISIFVILGFGIYLFFAIRGFYQQGIGKTILKYLLANIGFMIFGAVMTVISVVTGFILFEQ